MNAETTDVAGLRPTRGWIGYDGDCGLCTAGVRRWHALFERRGFVFLPLRNPWLRGRLGLREGEVPEEMKLLLADGMVVGGVAAIGILLRAVWWLAPLGWWLALPGIRSLARLLYRAFARRRHRFGACRLPRLVHHSHPAHRAFLELP